MTTPKYYLFDIATARDIAKPFIEELYKKHIAYKGKKKINTPIDGCKKMKCNNVKHQVLLRYS